MYLTSPETSAESVMGLTERPTVPRPKITTVEPFDISATFQAAPMPKM